MYFEAHAKLYFLFLLFILFYFFVVGMLLKFPDILISLLIIWLNEQPQLMFLESFILCSSCVFKDLESVVSPFFFFFFFKGSSLFPRCWARVSSSKKKKKEDTTPLLFFQMEVRCSLDVELGWVPAKRKKRKIQLHCYLHVAFENSATIYSQNCFFKAFICLDYTNKIINMCENRLDSAWNAK